MSYEIINPSKENLYEYVGVAYDMSTYVRFDKYGLYGIKNNANFIANSPESIENNASFGVTWKGFFIKNSYTNGYVSISENDDIKVVRVIPQTYQLTTDTTVITDKEYYYYDETTNSYIFVEDIDPECNPSSEGYYEILSESKEIKKIKIGALEFNANNEPIRYGISIRNDADLEVFRTDDNGDIIANNITIKGAIKASVFEYEEIQAIGGILVVRPSSTIKSIVGPYYENNSFIGTEITLENPDLFEDKDRCKLGYNGGYYTLLKKIIDEQTHFILKGFNEEDSENYITYQELIGSALVMMIRPKIENNNTIATDNYGIAINSSDSNVQAPQKAITLFETQANTEILGEFTGGEAFSYRGILGTLPDFNGQQTGKVDILYDNYMKNTQGIYTDNMYIGDGNEYIAFYEDNSHHKHLAIKASDLVLNVGGSVSNSLNSLSNRIDGIENKTNKNLHIDKSQIILYTTKENIDAPEVTHIESGLKLTSNRLQFIINEPFDIVSESNYQNNYNTWVEKESLNSQILYFNTAYPRIFDIDYIKTSDTFIVDGKTYYVYNSQNDDYDEVSDPVIDNINNYYEQNISNDFKGNLMIYARSNGHLTIKNIK